MYLKSRQPAQAIQPGVKQAQALFFLTVVCASAVCIPGELFYTGGMVFTLILATTGVLDSSREPDQVPVIRYRKLMTGV